MELYITTLPLPIVMWFKRSNAQTLQGAINEAVKVDNEMLSLTACHHTIGEKKASQASKKNNGSDNKGAETKEKNTTDVEDLHQIIKKLTNSVIDMKRNPGESTSKSGGEYNNRKPFKHFYRNKTESGHGPLALFSPPNEGNLNTEEMALIRSLLNQEEPIVELEPEHEDEEEYQVEESLEEESQINVLWDFYTNENDDDQ